MSLPPRKVAVLSSGRADYGLLYWTLHELHHAAGFNLQLIVTGMHLSEAHGMTVRLVEADPWPIAARAECLLASDTGAGATRSLGLLTVQMADIFERLRPDILLVLGDRFELLAATSAALLMRVPIAHLHGGETTLGAVDEQVRYAVSEMAHLHLPATKEYAANLEALGEEPWRIHVVGAPGLDWIRRIELPGRTQLEEELGLDLSLPWLAVTYHPATLEGPDATEQIALVLSELEATGKPLLFTLPNADPGGAAVRSAIERFVAREPDRRKILIGLGQARYLGLLKQVAAMVGNSSSGIIEAPSVGLPVVNIGTRQAGRARAASVIDVELSAGAIRDAIERATSAEFRKSIAGLENPYGSGDSSRRIVEALAGVELGERLLVKRRTFNAARG